MAIESESASRHNNICISEAKQWIEFNVEQKIIKSIPWSEFETESMKIIGVGNFGSVFKAIWSSTHSHVACKKLNFQDKAWEAFKHELHMQIRAHSCENVIRILGISNITDLSDEYVIVMEYADGGNLKNFLLSKFEDLDWNQKFQLALGITNGLYYLHKNDILHRDLVSVF